MAAIIFGQSYTTADTNQDTVELDYNEQKAFQSPDPDI
jgi:hypothetical protein